MEYYINQEVLDQWSKLDPIEAYSRLQDIPQFESFVSDVITSSQKFY
jgi:hypothetical protein